MTTHDCGQARDEGLRNSTFAPVRGLSIRGTHTPSLGPLPDVLLRLEAAFSTVTDLPREHRRDADEVRTMVPAKAVICEALPGAGLETVPGARHLSVAAALLILSVSAVSCSSGKVLNSANNYAFHTSRFNESCLNPAPGCACRHDALARWRVALDEARDAAKRGGKYPLQIRALKDAEAKLGACK